MGHDWILDVLTDLKTYARANGLPTLAEHLDDAQLVAQIEIASQTKEGRVGGHADNFGTGADSRAAGAR